MGGESRAPHTHSHTHHSPSHQPDALPTASLGLSVDPEPALDATLAASLLHKADAPVDSVVSLVGGTPIVKLAKSVPSGGATVLAKLESLQPNSSVKDR